MFDDVLAHYSELDMTVLEHKEYGPYFDHLKRSFAFLIEKHPETADELESNIIQDYLVKFLTTIELFGVKYLYDDENRLKVDLMDSGFPNVMEFRYLDADLLSVDNESDRLLSKQLLLEKVLDHMIRKKEDPRNLLYLLSQRVYLNYISERKVFRKFNHGELIPMGEDENLKRRKYMYHWACFDDMVNRPFIHMLFFEHDLKRPRLEEDEEIRNEFLGHIRDVGYNAPPLINVISNIDYKTEYIYPKLIKRFDIGPLYSSFVQDEGVFTKIILRNENKDAFAFFVTAETVESTSEIKQGSIFGGKKVHQGYEILKSDPECAAARLSSIERFLISSHDVARLASDIEECRKIFDKLTIPPITIT